jgi:hypothetical protein
MVAQSSAATIRFFFMFFPLEGCEGTFLDARTVRNEVEK